MTRRSFAATLLLSSGHAIARGQDRGKYQRRTVEWAIHQSPGPPPDASPGIEVTAIHDDPLKSPAALKTAFGKTEVWTRPLTGGAVAVAAFNNATVAAQVDIVWKELGIAGQPKVRDVLNGKDLGKVHGGFAVKLPAGGAALYRVQPSSR